MVAGGIVHAGFLSVPSQNKSRARAQAQPGSRMRMRPASIHPVMGEARNDTALGRQILEQYDKT